MPKRLTRCDQQNRTKEASIMKILYIMMKYHIWKNMVVQSCSKQLSGEDDKWFCSPQEIKNLTPYPISNNV